MREACTEICRYANTSQAVMDFALEWAASKLFSAATLLAASSSLASPEFRGGRDDHRQFSSTSQPAQTVNCPNVSCVCQPAECRCEGPQTSGAFGAFALFGAVCFLLGYLTRGLALASSSGNSPNEVEETRPERVEEVLENLESTKTAVVSAKKGVRR